VRDISILSEVRAQHKTNFKHFIWTTYLTYQLVSILAPTYNHHILSSDKVIKVCYLLPKICGTYVYLNLFG
jgi:hypothetical protein